MSGEPIGEDNSFALLLRSCFGDSKAKERLRELKNNVPGGIRERLDFLSYLSEGLKKGGIINRTHKPIPTDRGKEILMQFGIRYEN